MLEFILKLSHVNFLRLARQKLIGCGQTQSKTLVESRDQFQLHGLKIHRSALWNPFFVGQLLVTSIKKLQFAKSLLDTKQWCQLKIGWVKPDLNLSSAWGKSFYSLFVTNGLWTNLEFIAFAGHTAQERLFVFHRSGGAQISSPLFRRQLQVVKSKGTHRSTFAFVHVAVCLSTCFFPGWKARRHTAITDNYHAQTPAVFPSTSGLRNSPMWLLDSSTMMAQSRV